MSRSIKDSLEQLDTSLTECQTSLQDKEVEVEEQPKVSELPELIDSIKSGPSGYTVKIHEHKDIYGQHYNREDIYIIKTDVKDSGDPLYNKKFIPDETGPFNNSIEGPENMYATFHLPSPGEYTISSEKDTPHRESIKFNIYSPEEDIIISFPVVSLNYLGLKSSASKYPENSPHLDNGLCHWENTSGSTQYYKYSPWTLTFDSIVPYNETVNYRITDGEEYVTLSRIDNKSFSMTINDTSQKPGFVRIRFGINAYEQVAEDNGGNEAEYYLCLV